MDNTKPFIISDILKEAWQSCSDSKAAIWLPAIIILALSIVVGLIVLFGIQSIFFGVNQQAIHPIAAYALQLINTFLVAIVIAPYATGMLMVAIRRARGEVITNRSGLQYTPSWFKLAAINVMITIFAMIIDLFFVLVLALVAGKSLNHAPTAHVGGLLIVITIIMFLCYLTFYAFIVFALPIAIDKNKSVWDALSSGARIVTPHWIKMVGIEIIAGIILCITLLPLSLSLYSHLAWLQLLGGLISLLILVWTLPYVILIHGQAYKRLVD